MILPILLAAMMLVDPVAAPLPPITAPAPALPDAERPTIDPITAIDRLMEAYKGKPGDRLRGKLGLTHSTKPASDGEVVFWRARADSMGCGIGAGGVMRCGSAAGLECQLAVAFDKAGKVATWRASGAPEACVKIAVLLQPDR